MEIPRNKLGSAETAADVDTDGLPPALAKAFAAEAPAENDNTVPVDWDHLGPLLLKLARWDGLGL